MSSRDIESCLVDILTSAQVVEVYSSGLSLGDYRADPMRRDAIERRLQILTEAAYRLGEQATRLCPSVDWRSVRGLGNFLRHEYDRVNDELIWKVIKDDLPNLTSAVRHALSGLANEPSSTSPQEQS